MKFKISKFGDNFACNTCKCLLLCYVARFKFSVNGFYFVRMRFLATNVSMFSIAKFKT